MIVRKYGRRNRGITRTFSDTTSNHDVFDPFGDSFSSSQEQESPQEIYNFAFSSQDSTRWTFDSDPRLSNPSQDSLQFLAPIVESENLVRESKKLNKNGKRESDWERKRESKRVSMAVAPSTRVVATTATLMETQEFGEMMEHLDEVNFALDGLRKGQPIRIRRASLLSLLSICGTVQQRRLLGAQGVAKTIIDAILGLSLDDSSSNLAAAALFYLLTGEGQDDYLLDSPLSIRFLVKLLKPLMSSVPEDKAPSIRHKLLAFRKDTHTAEDANKRLDSSSAEIIHKVKEVLKHCEEMKVSNEDDGISRPELSSRWIALLTMEKASWSTISVEETIGTVRKHKGDDFKERLRELGALDAVFELALSFHFKMERWLECLSEPDTKDEEHLDYLVPLLRCLKIMENATFQSKENQSHLLSIKGNVASQRFPVSFTELMISFIKILSGLSLRRGSSSTYSDLPNGTSHFTEFLPVGGHKGRSRDSSLSKECCSTGRIPCKMEWDIPESSQRLSSSQLGSLALCSGTTLRTRPENCLIKMRLDSSASSSWSVQSRSSMGGTKRNNSGSMLKLNLGMKASRTADSNFENPEDSQDPFAFDEDESELSRWDVLSGKEKVFQKQKSRVICCNLENGCRSQLMLSQEESNNEESNHSSQTSCSSASDEEMSKLLADCLLTGVKVLMNLTNDNAVGCQQIADCGGLETLSSLIACHCPSFSSCMSPFIDPGDINSFSNSIELGSQTDAYYAEQELDLLVAILGLLVNMVEKNGHNRSRLAAASVSLPCPGGLEADIQRGVIPLLCSIFLANQGAGEAAEEGNVQPWDVEQAVLEGQKEAEKTIIEAYSALVLAFLSTESKSIREMIADYLPDHSLEALVPVLERFVAFHLALDVISPDTHKTLSEVIESCRVI